MFDILPSKESVRLFLRRHFIRANIEREQFHCLHDCLEEKPRRKNTWWLILLIPVFLILHVFVLIEETDDRIAVTDPADAFTSNVSLVPSSRSTGKQLAAPIITTTTKQDLEESWAEFWILRDAELHTYLLKKKLLEKERKNRFTPRPLLEITEIPITTTGNNSRGSLPVCKVNHNNTGNITLKLSALNGTLEKLYRTVKEGGLYQPPDCWSRHKVAILVPYRNRPRNLKTFLINIHPFLMEQKLEYRIFVAELHGRSRFNKGRLLNAGFKVLQKLGTWDCVVEHDVDLLPLDSRILYSCPTYPRVLSTAVLSYNGSFLNISDLPPRFGGVTSMSVDHFERVNGHSNLYQGLDNEDYDMYYRLRAAGLPITKNSKTISRYLQLPHIPALNRKYINRLLLQNAMQRYKLEGLSTLEYKVLNITYHHLFTHILVHLEDKPQRRRTRLKYSYKPPVYDQIPNLDRPTKPRPSFRPSTFKVPKLRPPKTQYVVT